MTDIPIHCNNTIIMLEQNLQDLLFLIQPMSTWYSVLTHTNRNFTGNAFSSLSHIYCTNTRIMCHCDIRLVRYFIKHQWSSTTLWAIDTVKKQARNYVVIRHLAYPTLLKLIQWSWTACQFKTIGTFQYITVNNVSPLQTTLLYRNCTLSDIDRNQMSNYSLSA